MARTTKIELQQALNALGEELKALRAEVSALRAENARLTTENAALRAAPFDIDEAVAQHDARVHAAAHPDLDRPATNPVAHARGRYVKNLGIRPAWQPSAAMQAARELAMRTGCVVRVG